nr:uncharacterized protein LOC112289554 [Physcomitrium patens]|eukprot:XP_024390586.1 uncharacterized protein LOC112289554 [Physcomitrella patens]
METARMLAVSSMGGIGFTSAEEGAGGDGLGDSSNNCLQLSRTNKLIAFSGFLGFGMLLQMMSMTMFLFPKKFAVMYTMGNLFTISRFLGLLELYFVNIQKPSWDYSKHMFPIINILT